MNKKWTFEFEPSIGKLQIVNESGETILNNKVNFPDARVPYDLDDWNLMTAAPELLDILKLILPYAEQYQFPNTVREEAVICHSKHIENARNIIAKAEHIHKFEDTTTNG